MYPEYLPHKDYRHVCKFLFGYNALCRALLSLHGARVPSRGGGCRRGRCNPPRDSVKLRGPADGAYGPAKEKKASETPRGAAPDGTVLRFTRAAPASERV